MHLFGKLDPYNLEVACRRYDASLQPVVNEEPERTHSHLQQPQGVPVYTYASGYIETQFHICGRSPKVSGKNQKTCGDAKLRHSPLDSQSCL